MARLEYRLKDEYKQDPVLYYYDFIDPDEISLRFACDYWIKNKMVYEKLHSVVEANKCVIFVQVAEDEHVVDYGQDDYRYGGGICIEVREYKEGTDRYPVVHRYNNQDDDTTILILQSDRLVIRGQLWLRTSTEVDEDRKLYVYYAEPSA
jgi:CMP-2-keto-3-deoxyoctulosonic acid synthetase